MHGQSILRPPEVGTLLAESRRVLGLSREALGAAAGGVSSSTIRRIERGEVRPHLATVVALTRAIDAHNDYEPAANGLVGKTAVAVGQDEV